MHKKPDVIPGKIIFYLTSAYPPAAGGSSVINRNLLAYFNEDSYVLIKAKRHLKTGFAGFIPKNTVDILRLYDGIPGYLFNFLAKLQIPLAIWRLNRLVKKYKPSVLVAAYPNYFFLKIAREVAKKTGIPLTIYLHDTLAEALSKSSIKEDAKILQKQLFTEADKIFVMSEGMQHLYKEKYNLDSTPILHSYSETIPNQLQEYSYKKTAFWGGSIYGINTHSVIRLNNAFAKIGFDYQIAFATTLESLQEGGIIGNHVKLTFYPERDKYIEAVEHSGLLTLALDWPEESSIHKDELATIFPTKTIEYLASGGLIVVHCPEDYFMAQFFKKYQCGIVISDRNPDKIVNELQKVLSSPTLINMYRENALKTAQQFSIETVASSFTEHLNQIMHV